MKKSNRSTYRWVVICAVLGVASLAIGADPAPESAPAPASQTATVTAPAPLPLAPKTKSGILFNSITRFFKAPEKGDVKLLLVGCNDPKLAEATLPGDVAKPGAVTEAGQSHKPEVHLVGVVTDACKRYAAIVPGLPIPPFNQWRQWFHEHETAVHCVLEWRNENGEWFHGELRSRRYDLASEQFRVGGGEFPGTGYEAYGIYILPCKMPRDKDEFGRKMQISLDEVVDCDYHAVERELRRYGDQHAVRGTPGTGGAGLENVGLGGPAYKPVQNSNTMVKYILRRCGVNRNAPDLAVGWDTEPHFPCSTNADAPALDNQ